MGLSGLFGFGQKKPATTPAPTVTSPAPTQLGTAGTIAAPPDVIKQTSAAEIAARQTALKTRRRAAAGLSSTSPAPAATILTPVLQPKTLLGY